MPSEFAEVLKQNFDRSHAEDKSAAALRILDEVCEAVLEITAKSVTCERRPNYPTNYGLEWRVVVTATKRAEQYVLFRAYVPIDGFPVRLDLYDGELDVCVSETDLRARLREFLSEATVGDILQHLSSAGSPTAV